MRQQPRVRQVSVGYKPNNRPRLSLEATGISDLRAYLLCLGAMKRFAALEFFLENTVVSLLKSVELFCNSSHTQQNSQVLGICDGKRNDAQNIVVEHYHTWSYEHLSKKKKGPLLTSDVYEDIADALAEDPTITVAGIYADFLRGLDLRKDTLRAECGDISEGYGQETEVRFSANSYCLACTSHLITSQVNPRQSSRVWRRKLLLWCAHERSLRRRAKCQAVWK